MWKVLESKVINSLERVNLTLCVLNYSIRATILTIYISNLMIGKKLYKHYFLDPTGFVYVGFIGEV